MLTTIPFSGFFQSCHDEVIDRAIECAAQIDSSGNSSPVIENELCGCIDFSEVHETYAKGYTAQVADFMGIELQFDDLSSPREYNFTTDRIFADISEADFRKLYDSVDKGALAKLVADKFTSRCGFISFYSGDIAEWPADITEWDHNQVGTVLELAATEEDWQEDSYADDADCNGDVSNWIDAALDERGHRLLKIAGYLRKRDGRRFA